MPKKILIAEDSPTQAQRAKLILENEGYSVSVAENGALGLEAARSDPPDMIVTDIMMPEMDGYEFCSNIKNRPETSKIPVVMLTTKDEVQDIVKGLGVGADNFITKPYESGYLLSRIAVLFENETLRRGGGLPEERELKDLQGKISLTSDRQQILLLLLNTISVLVHCNVMGLFLLSPNGRHSLYQVTLRPLSEESEADLTGKVLAAASALGETNSSLLEIDLTGVVKEEELPPVHGIFRSFISVPLINDGRIIGILTTANPADDAFQPDDVKLLYQIGMESASAFDRIKR